MYRVVAKNQNYSGLAEKRVFLKDLLKLSFESAYDVVVGFSLFSRPVKQNFPCGHQLCVRLYMT